MKNSVISTPEADVHFLQTTKAFVVTKDYATPSNPIERRDEELHNKGAEIAYWGENNDFPDRLRKETSSNSIVPSTIDFKARALFSQGLEYGYWILENNQKQFVPIIDEEIENFFWKSKINRYCYKAALDFYELGNVFPELVFSVDKKKVVSLLAQEAAFCRFEKQDQNGFMRNCFIKSNWKDKPNDTKDAIKVPILDAYTHSIEDIQRSKSHKFIFPLSLPTGSVYYQAATWYAVIKSGWLDVAKAIPAFKKALMQNQITPKYLIKIPSYYWAWKFPKTDADQGWESYSEDQKREKIKKALEDFEEFFSGEENTGKSMLMHYKFDEASKEKYPSWEIEPIKNEIKDGAYIEDSQEASSHILYALGVPAALLGNSPGKGGQGSGSGSDVREHFNAYWLLTSSHELLLTEPLRFIADYNGWNKRIKHRLDFRFKKAFLQTKDQMTPKKRENATE